MNHPQSFAFRPLDVLGIVVDKKRFIMSDVEIRANVPEHRRVTLTFMDME
jgi:hypothetical protein